MDKTAIIVAIIGFFAGGGFFGFLTFMIQRKDTTQKKLDAIIKTQKETELNLTRLQLLNLIQHEGSQHETMIVAQRYFQDLSGDWYMTPIFCRWLKQHSLARPAWFKGED